MKRKVICMILSLNFLFMAAACSSTENESVSENTSEASEASYPITEESTAAKTMSQTNSVTDLISVTKVLSDTIVSEIETEISETAAEENIPEEIFSEDDIYIYSFECGYISQDNKPPNDMLIIETEEQLSFAEDRYGLAVPDDLPESDKWWYDKEVAEAFQDMKASYHISEYSYAVCYDEVNCGGYYLHADKLIKKGELLYFGMDDKSYTPNEEEMYPQAEDGFCHMAAFPKSLFDGKVFSNAVYPDKNELTQDINYLFRLEYDITGKELFDAYGDDVYLIHSQEEYDEFLKLSENVLTDNRQIKKYFDFEKVSAAVCFFTREYEYTAFHNNGVIILDGNVSFDYDIEVNPDNAEKKHKPMTCMIYASIPKRFLE